MINRSNGAVWNEEKKIYFTNDEDQEEVEAEGHAREVLCQQDSRREVRTAVVHHDAADANMNPMVDELYGVEHVVQEARENIHDLERAKEHPSRECQVRTSNRTEERSGSIR